MHDLASPHCSYCQHFEQTFQTDLVVEWGYCLLKKVPPPEELERIKEKAESGDYGELFSRSEDLGLFMPTVTRCEDFSDLYPF
jgi:hypothetical protein